MSKTYFSKLNYTLANEDTSLEYSMVKALKPKRVLAVCGSGGRSLPLLGGAQDELVCADLSNQQLLLARLRVATIKRLGWQEFLLFWGFPPYHEKENRGVRKEMFDSLDLDSETKAYFTALFEEKDFEGLLYEGKWEKTFTGVPRLLRKILGSRYDVVFTFDDIEAQKHYFDKELLSQRWVLIPRLVLRAFGNAAFFNAFLYKGHFAKKNVPETHYDYYRLAYRRLFYQALTRKNFFLQLTFLGRLRFQEGNPIEAQEEVFMDMKERLNAVSIKYVNEDLISLSEKSDKKFDFVSLSDVPSYFSQHLEKEYLQKLSKGLNKGAVVVVRCYLRIPENTDLTGYKDVTEKYKALIDAEKTQIYYTFVYEYQG